MVKTFQGTLGPMRKDWQQARPAGDCECGGDCAPKCGFHPAGCIFGGYTADTAFWMIVEGCERYHGDGPESGHFKTKADGLDALLVGEDHG